jgi:general secretion pathway protein A
MARDYFGLVPRYGLKYNFSHALNNLLHPWMVMYTEYFGLREAPFSIAPDPRYLYMSEQHREALAHLLYGINSDGGFVLLTGEVGTGKTTVCRCLLEQMPEHCDTAFILNPKLTVPELLSTICDEFGIRYPENNTSIKVFYDLINAYLLSSHAKGRKAVLIIDEAQNLAADVLEQMRLLTNLETHQRKLLQILLLGQPELRDKLARPELRQLAQRIIARYHLGPLKKHEVVGYVYHRLAVAGARARLFPTRTLPKLYRYSKGIPRLINLLCDRALLGAYVQGKTCVDRVTLAMAAREVFGANPVRWRHGTKLGWLLSCLLFVAALAASSAALYRYHHSKPLPATMDFATLTRQETAQTSGLRKPVPSTAPQQPSAQSSSEIPSTAKDPSLIEQMRLAAWSNAPKIIPEITKRTQTESPVPLQKLRWPSDQPIESSEKMALQALFEQWKADYQPNESDHPCRQAEVQGLGCLFGIGGLDDLRILNRPAILKLLDDRGHTFYVTLIELRGEVATCVVGMAIVDVALDDIRLHWHGNYWLLWRMPEKYAGNLKAGDRGVAVAWLKTQLARVEGITIQSSEENLFDEALLEEVKKFQLSMGLKPDGIVGPQTLICLATATGAKDPLLLAAKKDG